MVKVKVLKVYRPNLFLGIDLLISDKVTLACNEIRRRSSPPLPCNEVFLKMVYLCKYNEEFMRLRILNSINTETFRCLFIDRGWIREIKIDKLFIIPTNQLQLDPAVKLFVISGIKMTKCIQVDNDAALLSTHSESNQVTISGVKFVDNIFTDCQFVNVGYQQGSSQEKAVVEVFVMYNNRAENLRDLLITQNFAIAITDGYDSPDSETLTKILLDFNDATTDNIPKNSSIRDSGNIKTTIKPSTDTPEEVSMAMLNNKIKSWLVSKSVVINNSTGDTFTKIEYKRPVAPILSYQNDDLLAAFLKDAMLFHKTKSLMVIQAQMIPAILQDINVVAISPPHRGKSIGMLMPILQKIALKPVSKTRSYNPLAIILCASWKKVDVLYDSAIRFMEFIKVNNKIRRPSVVSVYASRKEKKIMIAVLEGCDILIITPRCLLRLLKTHEFFKLDELEIIGLDDAENLIAHNLDVLKEIFIYKQTGVIESGKRVQQIVTATNWTAGLESFVQHEMHDPFMVTVNSPIEIAVFERLQQKLIECDNNTTNLYLKLHSYLVTNHCTTTRRTIIFASDDTQIRSIQQYLMQQSKFDLKLMLGCMTGSELNEIERKWNHDSGVGSILLISDEVHGHNNISISNAETICHADVNPTSFGSRLNYLRDNFAQLSFLEQLSTASMNIQSYVFICPSQIDLIQANFLYKFFGRCHSDRPVWLQEKAIDYVLNKEKSKIVNEICTQIKVKGECHFPACNKRHIVVSDVDKPLLPNRGQIKFRVLHLESPSQFYVRIIDHKLTNEDNSSSYKSQYTSVKMGIMKHFTVPDNVQSVDPKLINLGMMAAIRLNDILERVTVLQMNATRPSKIKVKLIDYGSTMVVEASDLLSLPAHLMDIPAQAVEVFVVGIRPLDDDEYYHIESCEFAKQFLDDKELYGVIMLCVGSTLWVDSVTQLRHHKTTNITVYEKNLSVELMEKNFVEKNPGHIQKLVRICTGKIDIWNAASQPESQHPVPIMRKFTYTEKQLTFEELRIHITENDTTNECTVLTVISPNMILLSNPVTEESIKQMQKEIKTLIDSIEAIPRKDLKSGNRVLFTSDADWLRGYIVKVDDDRILLFSLDWGTVVSCSTESCILKRLPTEYQELPYHVIVAGLANCSPEEPFSNDVNTVINNFVNSSNKNQLLTVTAYSLDNINHNALFSDTPINDLDIYRCLKQYSVSISKKIRNGDDEELFNVLVEKQCVIPSLSWIHMILPECQPFLSRLERSGSIPHLGMDILSTRDTDKRLKLSKNIERIITKSITCYERNGFVPSITDDILHTLLVLLHFVSEQAVFMCYYRSLTALLRVADKGTLPIHQTQSGEVFSIAHISSILYSYQSVIHHFLNHFNVTIKTHKVLDGKTFLEILQLLLVNTCFVNNLFADKSWVHVMANCVGEMQEDEHLYSTLIDVLVTLVMLSKNKEPFLAGIIKQCCHAIEHSESSVIWYSSMTLVGCLINCTSYHSLFRDLELFTVLFNKTMHNVHQIGGWTELHDTSLGILVNMWRNGSADCQKLVRDRVLSEIIKEVVNIVPGNKVLAKLHTDILIEESSVTNRNNAIIGQVTTANRVLPDVDASEWMVTKDNTLLKKHKKSFRKLYENSELSESSEETSSEESDSLSDVEVTRFSHGNHNPANEDNVLCFSAS